MNSFTMNSRPGGLSSHSGSAYKPHLLCRYWGQPTGRAYSQGRVGAISSAILVVELVWKAEGSEYAALFVTIGDVAAVWVARLSIIGYETLPAWFDRRRDTVTGLASNGLGIG